MTKPRSYSDKVNTKTRLNYSSGASECSPKCQCLFCKRKRGEEAFYKIVNKNKEKKNK